MLEPVRSRRRSVTVGCLVGLFTGVVGMALVGPPDEFNWYGGIVGAVGGGVAAAAVSDRGTSGDALTAGLAITVSSLAVFALIVVGTLVWVATDSIVSAAFLVVPLLLLGTLTAVPTILASVIVAVISGYLAASIQGLVGAFR